MSETIKKVPEYTARAIRKYQKENTKVVAVRFGINTESELLDHLEQQPNKSGYIKSLIEKDIAKGDNDMKKITINNCNDTTNFTTNNSQDVLDYYLDQRQSFIDDCVSEFETDENKYLNEDPEYAEIFMIELLITDSDDNVLVDIDALRNIDVLAAWQDSKRNLNADVDEDEFTKKFEYNDQYIAKLKSELDNNL